MTQRSYNTMERVLDLAARECITTARAADRLAEARIQAVWKIRRLDRRR